MKISKYLFILLFIFILQPYSVSAIWNGVSGRYWDYENQPTEIADLVAKEIGVTMYDNYFTMNDISSIQNGQSADYIRQGIDAAHANGIRYMFRTSEYSYVSTNNWCDFVGDAAAQTHYLYDMGWILNQYPDLDAWETEESEGDCGQAGRTFKNNFLSQQKDIVLQYHPNFDGGTFLFGFNMGNSDIDQNYIYGYDLEYILTNNLVNHIALQINQYGVQQTIDRYIDANNHIQGRVTFSVYLYVENTWAAWTLYNCAVVLTANCFNQDLIGEIDYVRGQGASITIFWIGQIDRPTNPYFPAYIGQGTTIGDVINLHWPISSSPTVSAPTFSPSPATYADNVTVYLSSNTPGASIYYTTDNTNPTSASTLYTTPLLLTSSTILKARGYLTGYANSSVSTGYYYITGSGSLSEPNSSDNNIKRSDPNIVFNNVPFLEMGCKTDNCSNYTYRSILRMNISEYDVSDAPFTLDMWLYGQDSERNTTMDVQIYNVSKPFTTNITNWNNYTTGTAWANPGGDWSDSLDVAQGTTPYATTNIPLGSIAGLKYSFNITDIVLDAKSNGQSSVNMMIKASAADEAEPKNYIYFYGLDYVDDPSLIPRINSSAGVKEVPVITSYSNNKTNDESTTIPIYLVSSTVLFSAVANQTVTWTWYVNNTLQSGAIYDNFSASFMTGGTYTVKVLANNINGSDLQQWTVIMISPTVPAIPTSISMTTGNLFANVTWSAGAGNITNLYEVMFYNTELGTNDFLGEYYLQTVNTFYNFTNGTKYSNMTAFVRAYNNSGVWSNFSSSVTDFYPPYLIHISSQEELYYNLTGQTGKTYTSYIRAYNSTFDTYSEWAEDTITYSPNITTYIYNTGYQYVLVNDTMTNTQLNTLWDLTWIIGWNSTSQKWESYKSGWSPRASRIANKGDAIGIKVLNNKSIQLTLNESYNWSLKPGENLIGIEYSKTLSEINASIGTCNVDMIEYVNLSTQTLYTFTCNESGNETIRVNAGEGVWCNSTSTIEKVRVW